MTAISDRTDATTKTATDKPVTKPRPGALAASGRPAVRPPAAAHLSDEQVAELGRELDAIKDEILAKRGASDAAYIRRVIKIQRGLEIAGRAALLMGRNKAAWVTGTSLLSLAKILENMEIGHNILHGQWDWMRDPDIHSTTWEWDFVTPARSWQHTHNDLHHRWTNVVGKDNDVGYNLLRMDEDQPWTPRALGNPLYNAILAPIFEWGIAVYDLELVDYKEGKKSKEAMARDLKALGVKALKQFTKDYAATPAVAMLTGSGKQALYGTLTANAVRNVWAHAVIFCGHFPEGTDTFTEEMVEGETRGDWYVRQMIGSANISGSKFMHIMTGNLSHQIEHHLFPDLPSNRYGEVAPKVQEICRRYGLPYTTGPLLKQVGSSWAKVFKLALPGKKA
ncbi:fatty acid desaturase family protein [Arthrobacter globiformis]|jgi:NADPH-dependent stearoyl-CoA 9-desaturase|uniref:fatty acid desaturase family protein n=1 Tax=Arthrobacter globiformis TaxID=1665 RepID=UPI00278A7EC4|nr:acyl-CoA desaturase [Arthrobacter globiformis]MDQ0862880.1 fatty acid desaturase [Arthrobacter globiformis]